MAMEAIKRESPLYLCESSDEKVTDVEIGAFALETDTKKVYVYDGTAWKEL